MQVSVESMGALERRMEIQIPADKIEQAVDARLQKLSRTVRMKGFRPGKVPVKVVRQQFGQQVRQEVLGDVVQSSFAEAIVQQDLVLAGGPRIEPITTQQGGDLKYRAVFEVLPRIDLQGIEGMEIARPTAAVQPADVDAMIDDLRDQRATYAVVDRAAQPKDRVTIDFDGTVDGQPFEGGHGENVSVVLGAGQMLADFEAGLQGVRSGERKSIELTFPANYGAPALANRRAAFVVNVKHVEAAQLPELDEAFCQSYGVESGGIERLREQVAENLRRELQHAVRSRMKTQIMDKLLEANPLELPRSLVDSQVRELQIDAGRRSGAQNASQLPPAESFVEAARRRTALSLLINAVIRAGSIQLDQARTQSRFEELTQQLPDAAKALQTYRSNPQIQRQIEASVLEDQAVDWVLERAKINDQSSSLKELMNFGA